METVEEIIKGRGDCPTESCSLHGRLLVEDFKHKGLHQLLNVIAQDKPLIVVQVSSDNSRIDSRIVCFMCFKCIEMKGSMAARYTFSSCRWVYETQRIMRS